MTENTPEHEHGTEMDRLLADDCATTASSAYVAALRFVRAFEQQAIDSWCPSQGHLRASIGQLLYGLRDAVTEHIDALERADSVGLFDDHEENGS